jgi:hypothetical protein
VLKIFGLSITQNIFFNDKFDLENPPLPHPTSHPRTYWFKPCKKRKKSTNSSNESVDFDPGLLWFWRLILKVFKHGAQVSGRV